MPPTHPMQADVAAAYRTLIAHETEPKEQDFYRTRLQRLEPTTEPESDDFVTQLAVQQIEGEAAWWRSIDFDRNASRTFESMTGDSQQAVRTGVERVLAYLQSTGRLIPPGGMALTAEQAEDVRIVTTEEVGGYTGEQFRRWHAAKDRLVESLFPATDPAEETAQSAGGDCFDVCEGHPVEPPVVHVHHHDIEAHATSFNEGYDEAVRQLADPAGEEDIENLIAKSSLGTESAQAAIESVSPEHGRLIVAIAEQRAKTEALAKFMYEHGKPELSQEDREILGPWESMDEVTQKIWINLADAAYVHIADEIDNEKNLLTEKVKQLQAQVKHLSRVAVNAAEHGIKAPSGSLKPCGYCHSTEATLLHACTNCGAMTSDPWPNPTPAEPAEEEAKAEVRIGGVPNLLDATENETSKVYDEAVSLSYWLAKQLGEHVDDAYDRGETLTDTVQRLIEHIRPNRGKTKPSSSPVVPAPTETGPWKTCGHVPIGIVFRSKDRHPAFTWVNEGGSVLSVRNECEDGHFSDGEHCLPSMVDENFAPFVAAEEG